MGIGLTISADESSLGEKPGSSPSQKTKKAIILPVVIPICSGIRLGIRSSDGQMDLSMMYIHEDPIIVLILPDQLLACHEVHAKAYPK